MIRKLKNQNEWRLYSTTIKNDKRKILGTFTNRSAAVKREKQIQYFKHLEKNPMSLTQENIRRWMLKFLPIWLPFGSEYNDDTIPLIELKKFFNITNFGEYVSLSEPIVPFYIANQSYLRQSPNIKLLKIFDFYKFFYETIDRLKISNKEKLNYWKYYMKSTEILNIVLLKSLEYNYDKNEILKIIKDWWGFWIERSGTKHIWQAITIIMKNNYEKLD